MRNNICIDGRRKCVPQVWPTSDQTLNLKPSDHEHIEHIEHIEYMYEYKCSDDRHYIGALGQTTPELVVQLVEK